MLPFNTIQYNTIQYNTIQYNTIKYNTIKYNTIKYNTIKYNTVNAEKEKNRTRGLLWCFNVNFLYLTLGFIPEQSVELAKFIGH